MKIVIISKTLNNIDKKNKKLILYLNNIVVKILNMNTQTATISKITIELVEVFCWI